MLFLETNCRCKDIQYGTFVDQIGIGIAAIVEKSFQDYHHLILPEFIQTTQELSSVYDFIYPNLEDKDTIKTGKRLAERLIMDH
jgi:hypothetical protein